MRSMLFLTIAMTGCGQTDSTLDYSNSLVAKDDEYPGVVAIQTFEKTRSPLSEKTIKIHFPDGQSLFLTGYCSGFFITPKIMMTAEHCIDTADRVWVIGQGSKLYGSIGLQHHYSSQFIRASRMDTTKATERTVLSLLGLNPKLFQRHNPNTKTDAALVVFEKPVVKAEHVLNLSKELPSRRQRLTGVGYGVSDLTDWNDELASIRSSSEFTIERVNNRFTPELEKLVYIDIIQFIKGLVAKTSETKEGRPKNYDEFDVYLAKLAKERFGTDFKFVSKKWERLADPMTYPIAVFEPLVNNFARSVYEGNLYRLVDWLGYCKRHYGNRCEVVLKLAALGVDWHGGLNQPDDMTLNDLEEFLQKSVRKKHICDRLRMQRLFDANYEETAMNTTGRNEGEPSSCFHLQGDSGGPLLNPSGEVVGIASGTYWNWAEKDNVQTWDDIEFSAHSRVNTPKVKLILEKVGYSKQ